MSKRCQSCGIPLHKDPAGGGSEADGTRSTTYCSYCFSNGKFIIRISMSNKCSNCASSN